MKDDNCVFFWIGAPTDKTLEAELKQQQETAPVFFTGDIPEASRLISYADIFVLFSDYEGLPITILEAMAKGKPVVASKVGGIPELVDARNGSLIIPSDTSKMTEDAVSAVKELVFNDELRIKKGEASLKKYEENFTINSMWDKYYSLYLSCQR